MSGGLERARDEGRWTFVLGLAVASALAAVDAAVEAPAVLAGLLVAAPLIAATRCAAWPAAVVGAYALALAVALGWANHTEGSAEHLTSIFTVAVGGGLAAVIARLRTARERDSVRQAARESEARKSAVLASALDCVITTDREGRVLELNEAAERAFGYRADEAVGRELAELIVPPRLRARHREELRRVEGERDELRRLKRRARLDAAQARDQLEAILRGVADAVTAEAPDGSLVFVNDAAVEVLGFTSRDEVLQAALSDVMERLDLLDEEGRPFPAEELPGRRALRGEERAEALVRFRLRATGEERWAVVKATPIFDGDGHVTMAINVIEDITEHKRVELEQRFLAESGDVLSTSLDPDDTLRRVAMLAVPQVADWCAVDLRGPGGRIERVALAHADPALLEEAKRLQERYPPDPDRGHGVSQVLRTGEPLLQPVIPDDLLVRSAADEEHRQLLREFGFRSAMIVPMRARGRTIGALTLASGKSGRRFDERDLRLCEELARRCASAIDHASLYTERAHIAKTLQQSLLPAELPEIPGLETAARFRPTGEGNEVGGDFYDLFESGGSGWTIVMGDVCGKGPGAAAITALARYTLRAAAMRERRPSRSLRVLNEALLRQRDDRRFCTVAYAYLEGGNGGAHVGFASGGHPLPLLLRSDGSVERLGCTGTLLGVVPDPTLEDRSAHLRPGDALVFYTDGVTDARRGAVDDESLTELVASCRGQAADAIAARIEAAAVAAQSGDPGDDIAVLVLRVAG